MKRLPLLTACGVLVCGMAVAAEDPIQKKLSAAKEEFAEAVEKARSGLLSDLRKREEIAQNVGDLRALVKVRAEAKAFVEKRELPRSVSVKGYESQMRTACARLDESYAAAIKQYTKDGKIALANAIDEERTNFKKDNSWKAESRKRWVHANGEFVETKEGIWEERSSNGKKYQYKEVARTKEYIEIDAVNGDTSLTYRLYDDRCDYVKRPNTTYTTMFGAGKWTR